MRITNNGRLIPFSVFINNGNYIILVLSEQAEAVPIYSLLFVLRDLCESKVEYTLREVNVLEHHALSRTSRAILGYNSV